MNRTEQELFSKWYGKDFVNDDAFWDDVFQHYSKDGTNIALPLALNPQSARMAFDMLDCPPGKCGECCRYEKIPLHQYDVERITANTSFIKEEILKFCIVIDKKVYLNGKDDCPFLDNNTCKIYKFRPDGCYLFPLQSPIEAEANGKKIQQMTIRLKCRPALEVARKIILRALDDNRVLLPNLTIIEKEVKDGSDTKFD